MFVWEKNFNGKIKQFYVNRRYKNRVSAKERGDLVKKRAELRGVKNNETNITLSTGANRNYFLVNPLICQ